MNEIETKILPIKTITKPRKKCEHGKQHSKCKDCKGSGICNHKRERYRCKDCRGRGICEHKKQRPQCRDCKSSQIYKYNQALLNQKYKDYEVAIILSSLNNS